MSLNDFGGYSHKMSRVTDNTAITVDITYVSHREGESEKQGNSDQLVTERETLKTYQICQFTRFEKPLYSSGLLRHADSKRSTIAPSW